MAHTGKVRELKNRMIEIYGPNCWMGYRTDKKNGFTYHHIQEQRNGGKDTLENGANLTSYAHRDLNELDAHLKSLYHEFNDLFTALNSTNKPPTIEYYKELYKLLIKASEYIELNRYCVLKSEFDFGLLKEMIEKAEELNNTKGHIELMDEYNNGILTKDTEYEKIDGIYIPIKRDGIISKKHVTKEYLYEGYVEVNKVYVPISYVVTEIVEVAKPVKNIKKEKGEKPKREEPVYISEEHKSKVKHKNRNHKLFCYRKNRFN